MKIKKIILLMLFSLCLTQIKAQFYSASSNLLGDATLNMNAEFSMTIDRNWSLHLPLIFNPFIYKRDPVENKKFQNLTFMPGVRYWFKESYRKNYVGIYAIASRYHISKIWDDYRYDGYAVGAGISYGQAYPLDKRWNFEWELGAGLVYTWYDKYTCKKCGRMVGSSRELRFLPSKLSASLVYLF